MKIRLPLLALLVATTAACGDTSTEKTANEFAAPAASATIAAGPSEAPSPTGTAAPSEAPEPTETAAAVTELKVGQGITVTGEDRDSKAFQMTVQTLTTKSSKAKLDEYGEPPTKGRYLGIQIQYSCISGGCDYNPYDFVLRNEDGEEFSTTFPPYEPDLQSGTLNAGRKAKGFITYDVAPGKYFLEYRSNFLDDNAASWNIAVV